MTKLLNRLASLLAVKSLVALVLTIVFAVMAVSNEISQDFMTVYVVVIAFYFGTENKTTTGGGESSGGDTQ